MKSPFEDGNQIGGLLLGEHRRTLVRDDICESQAREAPECFPDRNSGDLKPVGDLPGHQACAWAMSPVNDLHREHSRYTVSTVGSAEAPA